MINFSAIQLHMLHNIAHKIALYIDKIASCFAQVCVLIAHSALIARIAHILARHCTVLHLLHKIVHNTNQSKLLPGLQLFLPGCGMLLIVALHSMLSVQ